MKPVDFRNETFAQLEARIEGQRAAVLAAWRDYGPGTTKLIAERSGISILTLRPRTTELVQLGYLALVDESAQTVKGEGIYRAAGHAEVLAFFQRQRTAGRNPQRELPLNV